MDKNIIISKTSDEDNCVSYNCPYCNERFKLEVREFKEFNGDRIYCPYCGLNSPISDFYSDDINEVAELEIENAVTDLMNDFLKGLQKKSSKNLKISTKPMKKNSIPTLYETDNLELMHTECCNNTVKINRISHSITHYCPYCGGNA